MSAVFKILIFSKTTAYRHSSIPAGIRGLHRLTSASASTPYPFTAEDTEDSTVFNPTYLSAYRVIVLLQCSGDILTANQLDALKGFVRSGGGIVAVHCSSFAMQSSEWYGRLISGVFDNHPEPQVGRVTIVDSKHPVMACLPASGDLQSGRAWMDEWYNFKPNPSVTAKNLHVLLAVDEKSYKGGEHGDNHPIVWCQTFDGGRSFYTSLGHFDEAYEDVWFMNQLLGGIIWAAGLG
ncbi:hypothetical protein MMYC01_206956 [Madurella mycetomatis]|uniref:ThuA-like domain-containing protein n=1 Tax=Madurella mycetomatis TaxID=100816 RepID=A0A175VS00_9PEZI|nr:hypothetical protein MMYC01_209392 [Madurella mycetomatis]KXX76013.1 hypothetical protein MMYC01_206956 [Madurella mycetomatis]